MTHPVTCVLCRKPAEYPILTSDGHVCLMHLPDPYDDLHFPPLVIRMWSPDGNGLDVTYGNPNIDPNAPASPAPKTISMDFTVDELLEIKDALILAASYRKPIGGSGRFTGLNDAVIVKRINLKLMEDIGIVDL